MSDSKKKIPQKGLRLNWKPLEEVKAIDLFSLKITRKVVGHDPNNNKRHPKKSEPVLIP